MEGEGERLGLSAVAQPSSAGEPLGRSAWAGGIACAFETRRRSAKSFEHRDPPGLGGPRDGNHGLSHLGPGGWGLVFSNPDLCHRGLEDETPATRSTRFPTGLRLRRMPQKCRGVV